MKYKNLAEYILAVDYQLIILCGMSHGDLPDWDYSTAYEEDVQPYIAARRIIKAAKEY